MNLMRCERFLDSRRSDGSPLLSVPFRVVRSGTGRVSNDRGDSIRESEKLRRTIKSNPKILGQISVTSIHFQI